MKDIRRYTFKKLPIAEDLTRYAISYTPEKLTREEINYLTPFFTNINKPIFALKNLPEEIAGALSSRYSRATKTMRRMFLDEYIGPIIRPQSQKSWEELSKKNKAEALKTKEAFLEYIEFFHKKGGFDEVVNIQRGRKFFDKWLADYGDDSIAEMGGVHLCIEGLSNIATREMVDKRVGLSIIEKSTRYVQFWEKRTDREYQYIVPGELRGTSLEKRYKEVMNMLFDTYSSIAPRYHEYIMKRYPKGEDETDGSFVRSRSAKRFDDIRDLLPFATQTFFAMYGNGRAFEDLVNRLIDHEVGEVRYWGQAMGQELKKVVPSFVTRPETPRGAEVQLYRSNIEKLRDILTEKLIKKTKKGKRLARWTRLVTSTREADVEVLAAFLFPSADLSYQDVRRQVKSMSQKKRSEYINKILGERAFGRKEAERFRDRFKKVPRAFESASFLFEIWGRAGDYRDLHRHRQASQERQRFTVNWGYDLEKEVLESSFILEIKKAYKMAEELYQKLYTKWPAVAQYVVPFAYLQHWYMQMSAREVYWLVELRSGPQGREHYRQISQDIGRLAKKAAPAVFQKLMIDTNSYALARRESEKKIEKKKKALGIM